MLKMQHLLLLLLSIAHSSYRVDAQPPTCGNGGVSESMRQMYLNTHNTLRAQLARGTSVANGRRGIAPPAALMYQLRYNCEAEAYAYQHVMRCDGKLSPPERRGGYRENFHVFNETGRTLEGAINAAMATWWRQINVDGYPTRMVFTRRIWNSNPDRRKWSKMAWGSNRALGCATRRCRRFYFTSCMYSGNVNTVGQSVYPIGPACSGCPGDTFCNPAEGLCRDVFP